MASVIITVGGGSSSGNVVGPASATDNALVVYDGTTGKLIKNSVMVISGTGIAINSGNAFGNGIYVLNAGGQLFAGTNGTNASLNISIPAAGQVRFATDSAGRFLSFADGDGSADALVVKGGRVILPLTVTPASAAATGVAGTVCWDASFIYICVATDTWKRVAIATW